MKHRRSLLIIILIAFAPLLLPAQEKVPRKLYLGLDDGAGVNRQRSMIVKEYLALQIAEETTVVITEKEEDADCTLMIAVTESNDGEVLITAKAADILLEEEPFTYRKGLPRFSASALNSTVLQEITREVESAFPPMDQEVLEVIKERVVEQVEVKQVKGLVAVLTVKGEPGTEIRFSSGEKYTVRKDGKVGIDLPYNISVTFTARHPDYYPDRVNLVVEEKDLSYTLDQKPLSRWGLDLRFRFYEFILCPGGLFFFYPGHGYVSLYVENNILSPVGRSIWEGDSVLRFFSPVVAAGWYFFPPGNIFRMAVSAGVFTKIVLPPEEPVYFSRLMPFGFQLGISGEFSPFNRVRFYFEYTPRVLYSQLGGDTAYLLNFNPAMGLPFPNSVHINDGWFFQYGLLTTFGVRILF